MEKEKRGVSESELKLFMEVLDGVDSGYPIIDVDTGNKAGCENCVGACCRKNMIMSLSKKDYRKIADAGTDIAPYKRRRGEHRAKWMEKLYVLNSDCGNLGEGNECKIYNDRPRVCREFSEAGVNCLILRHRRGMRHKVQYPTDRFWNNSNISDEYDPGEDS